jgi:hypothetical protein
MGFIGDDPDEIEFEPLPTTEPVKEPSPAPAEPAPAEPAEPKREEVPA